MAKTVDLERSKRLKKLGWGQDGSAKYWFEYDGGVNLLDHNGCSDTQATSAPTAGEMIEWLLGHFFIHITDTHVEVADQRFSIKDGLCNALADAVIWVMERKDK